MIITSIALIVVLMMVSSTQASIGLPDYDSGWISISRGQYLTLTHNLNTTELLVHMIGRSEALGIHNYQYGGDESVTTAMGLRFQNLGDTTITLYRLQNDQDGKWDQVRVMIWKIEPETGVGGLTIPVDKFSLLAPYIALASTTVLAVSISVAYIKYRKKQ